MPAKDELKQVAEEVSTCTRCKLHFSRKLAVPGEGPAQVEIMLIGEGPGFHENEQGRPFVGAAGKFLDELLAAAGVKRSDVFITNIVKCRPPGNRDPEAEEIEAFSNYLDRQIQALNPKVIVTLGRHSMAKYLPNAKISDVHGQAMNVKGRLVIAMYHPAAALHQQSLKSTLQEDFSRLPALMAKTAPTGPSSAMPESSVAKAVEEQPPAEPKKEAKQLSLF